MTEPPKERGILFSGPMVRALLDGAKTQTRRAVKPMAGEQSRWLTDDLIQKVPHGTMSGGGWQMHHPKAGTHVDGVYVAHDSPLGWIRSPYGRPGDRLWVRESWRASSAHDSLAPRKIPPGDAVEFSADQERVLTGKGRPSIFMPRWASRITLEITDVRVERLQDISDEDAAAEGVVGGGWYLAEQSPVCLLHTQTSAAKWNYGVLWDAINGKGSWAANPWVWVVEFTKVGDQ